MTRYVKRGGKIWIRMFPDKPITKKPLEVRQGKGKGNVEYWVALVQPGRMLYEIAGVTEEVAREAFALAAAKLLGQDHVHRTDGMSDESSKSTEKSSGMTDAQLGEELLQAAPRAIQPADAGRDAVRARSPISTARCAGRSRA